MSDLNELSTFYKKYLLKSSNKTVDDIETNSTSGEHSNQQFKASDNELEEILARKQKLKDEISELMQQKAEIENRNQITDSKKRNRNIHEINSRSIFILNLDNHAKTGDLARYFGRNGPINRITIPKKHYAYIEFANSDSASNALALDGTMFLGRRIRVSEKRTKRCPSTARSNNELEEVKARKEKLKNEIAESKSENEEIERRRHHRLSDEEKAEFDSRSICVGNVDPIVTTEGLRRHFVRCGVINRVTMLTNKFTGQSLERAYIEFANVDSVALALSLANVSFLRGRKISVRAKRIHSSARGLATREVNRRDTGFGPSRGTRTRYSKFYAPYAYS
uniref:RRM domain-containing protein n=1 Tax=Strigamia maritima TaxID=126957 RepID=T1JAG6_STRMM